MIRNYRENRAVSKKAKVTALIFLWLSLGTSILFVVPLLPVKILLGLIGAGVTLHLLKMKTI